MTLKPEVLVALTFVSDIDASLELTFSNWFWFRLKVDCMELLLLSWDLN